MRLEGEAYFAVIHDERRPFVVHAGDLVAHDLGAEFTVRAHPEDAHAMVVVREGEVGIRAATAADGTVRVLMPGQLGRLSANGEPIVEAVGLEPYFAWTDSCWTRWPACATTRSLPARSAAATRPSWLATAGSSPRSPARASSRPVRRDQHLGDRRRARRGGRQGVRRAHARRRLPALAGDLAAGQVPAARGRRGGPGALRRRLERAGERRRAQGAARPLLPRGRHRRARARRRELPALGVRGGPGRARRGDGARAADRRGARRRHRRRSRRPPPPGGRSGRSRRSRRRWADGPAHPSSSASARSAAASAAGAPTSSSVSACATHRARSSASSAISARTSADAGRRVGPPSSGSPSASSRCRNQPVAARSP